MYQVKRGKSKGCLPTVPLISHMTEGSAMQLSSANCIFYLPYRNPTNTIQHIEIPCEFMKLNGWKEGNYTVKNMEAQVSKNMKVIVSEQHYEVIQQNKGMLEQTLLGQAQLVWNGLIMPISYAQYGTVKMKCECEPGVWRLAEDTLLDIEPEKMTQVEQQKDLIFKVVAKKDQLNCDVGRIHPNHMKGLLPQAYYMMQPYEYVPPELLRSFSDYLKNTKSFEQKKSTSSSKLPLMFLKFKFSADVDEDTIVINPTFWRLNNEPSSLKLVQQYASVKDSHLALTFDYFSADQKTTIFFLSLTDQLPHVEQLYERLAQQVLGQAQCLFVNNNLVMICNQYFMIRLESTENKAKQEKTIQLNSLLIKKNRDVDKQKAVTALKKKVVILPQKAYASRVSEAEKTSANKRMLILKQRSNQKTSQVSAIFGSIYEEQLKKLRGLLNKKQHVMLASPNKNGKTFMYHYLRQELDCNIFYIDLAEISIDTSSRLKDILDYFELVFQTYSNHVIFLDNIDVVCKDAGNDRHRQQQIIAAKILSNKLWEFMTTYSQQSCVMTVQNADNIEQSLKQIDIASVVLRNPATEARRKYLHGKYADADVKKILENTESLSFRKLADILTSQSKIKKLLCLQEEKQDLHDFKKIAGLRIAKQAILQIVESPFKYSYLYKDLPIKMPKGVLLYGPSGVGKTYLATAVKQQLKMSFFEVKGTDIFNMYIGASEQAVRDIFQKAMAVAPSVIFFDEFQTLVPVRTADSSGVGDRVVNQFLCYLDGVSNLEGVFILAASSKPHLIDPALLRPGRIDKHVFLDYPTSEERFDLLNIFGEVIKFEYPLDYIVDKTEFYSYSDMVGLLQELRIKKASRLLKQPDFDKNQVKYMDKQFFDEIFEGRKIPMTADQKKQLVRQFEDFQKGRHVAKQRTALK